MVTGCRDAPADPRRPLANAPGAYRRNPMGLRVAVAQLSSDDEVPTAERLAEAGSRVRLAMREAAERDARLVLFHEGALTYPHKRKISSTPGRVGPSDWSLVDWAALRGEVEHIAADAKELRLWTVIHSLHPLSDGTRPHNSLYVVSDAGEIVTRYDKRLLSHTEVSYMYTPGTAPIVFDVDGYRFGSALCIEIQFPEVFLEYAALGVDCVLFSSSYGADFPRLAQAHASLNSMWVAVAMSEPEDEPCSGISGPDGRWITTCDRASPSIAVGDLDREDPALASALLGSRWGREIARSGELHEPAKRPSDPRSADRTRL